jgi:hypothetical protein
MGLTIYYDLKAKTDAGGARRLVKRLHRFAAKLPFDDCSEIFEYDPPGGRHAFTKGPDPDRKPGAWYFERRRADGLTELVTAPALHVLCFHANTRGAETATFGLASHPPVVVHHEDVITPESKGRGESRRIGAGPAVEVPTRLRGWYAWHDGCKTQYAANPRHGGVENFLRAHLSIFRVLDEARRLGMKVAIRDDAKYQRHRDPRKLLAELARWDELVASIVGPLTDALAAAAPGGTVVAPIKDRPDFEHLEARGADRSRRKQRK